MEGALTIGLLDEVGRVAVAIRIIGHHYHMLRWGRGGIHYEHVYNNGLIEILMYFVMMAIRKL